MGQATRHDHLNFSDYVERVLREGAMWSLMCVALYLLAALASYTPDDPGWSYVGETAQVRNIGGRTGAWFADVTLYLFGFFAYLLPVMLGASAWLIFRRRPPAVPGKTVPAPTGQPRAWMLSLRWLGFLLTLAAGSAYAAMHLEWPDARLPNGSGGGLGILVSRAMIAAFNPVGSDLLLAGMLLAGLTLLLGMSWFGLLDRLGASLRQHARSVWTALSGLGGRLAFARIGAPGTPVAVAAGLPEALSLVDPAPPPPPPSVPAPAAVAEPRVRRQRGGVPERLPQGVRDALIEPARPRTPSRSQPRPDADPPAIPRDLTPDQLVSPEIFIGASRSAPSPSPSPAVSAVPVTPVAAAPRPVPPVPSRTPPPAPAAAPTAVSIAKPAPAVPPSPDPDAIPRPPLDLLDAPRPSGRAYTEAQIEDLSRQVEARLADFGVDVQVVAVYPGPVVTLFELDLAPGIKASKITGLARDLARALTTVSVRVVEIIPGKSVIGIEIPNRQRETVFLRQIFGSGAYQEARSPLTLGLGTDISGQPVITDLGRMPHVLIAGTTGSGKSVAINAMILSLLYKAGPEDVRLIMVDPKMLELSVYEGIPHLLTPVVTDMKEAANALRWCVGEMERRYRLMSKLGVRNIAGYNRQVAEAIAAGAPIPDPTLTPEQAAQQGIERPTLGHLPYIVVIIDELADMMMVVGKKVEELIARLAQKARASGIHLLLATQRPSVDVLTGLIKANIPTRIAFQVSSRIDSRTVLDQMGAEQLLGHGDMLYLPPGGSIPQRVHGAFVDDHEVHKVVEFLKQFGAPDYIDDVLREPTENLPGIDPEPRGGGGDLEDNDPLFDEAVRIVLESRRASISGVQRRLKIGYNRAARMIEEMERIGIVGPAETNGNREVLAPAPAADD